MIPIFIVSAKNYSGKTFIALGLLMKLIEEGYKVGYMKPLGKIPVKKGSEVFDADAIFIKDALSLLEPMNVVSPFVLGYETQNLIIQGKIKDAKKKVLAALKSMKGKDFVVISRGADLFDGSALGINALNLSEDMNARVLMVEPWGGESSADSLLGIKEVMGERIIGGIINKVPQSALEHVGTEVKGFLEKKGIKIFGVFKKDSLLESFTVRQLNEILSGRVLCCSERLDEPVENFMIGAMDVDSALSYFRRIPNKAVITGAHRSDIQLAAMETSTRCIILTGGLYTNDVVIGKAESKGIPIISVAEDTFTTVDRIEALMGKTRIRGEGKLKRVSELFNAGFDMKKFMRAVK
ncbi:MAG: phosphotransacetylase family protein [Nitrospirae bacterium]|nr:phosphotransacetylase family protein [Nitrospirota bacterium]